MSDLNDQLRGWREAGIITDDQASAIAAFERKSTDHGRGILLAEALGYVGAAIAVAAVWILLASRWDSFNFGGRVALVGLLTAIVAGAGLSLAGSTSAPIRRLVSLLLTSAIGGVTWIVGIVVYDAVSWSSTIGIIVVGVTILVLATFLYLWRNRALPQVAMLAGALLIVAGCFTGTGLHDAGTWGALTSWAVGLAWALLGLGGWLRPAAVAVSFGTSTALVSAQVASFGGFRLVMLIVALATAGAVLGRGVVRAEAYLVTIGSIGVLVFLPQLVVHLFGNAIGALVTMLVVGLLLVVVSVRLARARSPRSTEASS